MNTQPRHDHLSKYPLVSVGLPTYNGEKKIAKALMSVLNQEYPNLELIISDNCSSDNTMEVCMELGKKNQSIRYFRQSHNIGLMPNFEFVLRQATGDLFMWMSDDDSLEPGILHKYVDFLMNNREYSLVCGQIKYWIGDQPIFCEQDFNIEQNWGVARLINFYFKVVYGSIFYGLMPKEIAQQIPLKNRMGNDWHFIAGVAYLGKIKNLDCIGYHKKCGGISGNFKQYGKTMGASSFAVRFPHVQIALDAFSNILHHSPVYARQHYLKRMILAFFSLCSILIGYYGKLYPLILGGKIKRLMGFKTSRGRYHTA
jgi:glycosyltransferase involved in cell wall biosynthesis